MNIGRGDPEQDCSEPPNINDVPSSFRRNDGASTDVSMKYSMFDGLFDEILDFQQMSGKMLGFRLNYDGPLEFPLNVTVQFMNPSIK